LEPPRKLKTTLGTLAAFLRSHDLEQLVRGCGEKEEVLDVERVEDFWGVAVEPGEQRKVPVPLFS
jgi:hypothetical protein